MAKETSGVSFKVLKDYTTSFKDYNSKEFVAKETGKGLSANDFTDDYKDKLDISITQNDFETEEIDWNSEYSV